MHSYTRLHSLVLTATFAALVTGAAPVNAQQLAPALPPYPTLAASGQGEAKVTPDRAAVTVNVQTRASAADVAASDNARRTRAVMDALPLLERASHVHVVAFQPEKSGAAHGEEPGADIALYLTRHGVKVTVSRYDAPDVDIGSQLLSRAFDLSADLIVMGAWGHSRLREFVLGSVTRTLLESMTVPVLMSH